MPLRLKYFFWLLGIFSTQLSYGQGLQKNIDSLEKIFEQAFTAEQQEQRLQQNALFVKYLVETLKTPYSFKENFDQLKGISVLSPPNQSFRIFSWYIPLQDGTYRFYGAIQLNTPQGALKLIPLEDQTLSISDTQALLSAKQWYGARYYEIVQVTSGRSPYYLLLGWKSENNRINKKLIEVLSFTGDTPVFGKNIFEGKDLKTKNRIIFQYNKQNAMTLRMDSQADLLVFDHLSPLDASKEGQYEYYASDLSFDAFKIVNGRLLFKEQIELNNAAQSTDELYADPKKKQQVERKF